MLWEEYKTRFPTLDSKQMLALLPVRLETRFYPPEQPTQLWVRIYPEPLTVDSWVSALSPSELAAGTAYWRALWKQMVAVVKVGGNYGWLQVFGALGKGGSAWDDLVNAVGSKTRALTAVTQLWPKNLKSSGVLAAEPELPKPTLRAEGEADPPVARLLPDCWVVSGKGVMVSFQVVGAPITAEYPCGPAISLANRLKRDAPVPLISALLSEAKADWMVDFDVAVTKGMAVKIPLSTNDFSNLRVSGLTVRAWGVRSGDSSASLEALLRHQQMSQGIAMVAPGTPTNNTGESASGWTPADGPSATDALGMPTVTSSISATKVFSTSGGGMARAFGLGTSSVLCMIPGSGTEASEGADALAPTVASALNRVLWYGTWGTFFKDILGVYGISASATSDLRQWFLDWVRADGPLPTLRIGRQPYGILPVRLPQTINTPSGKEQWIEKIVQEIRDRTWERLVSKVPRLDPTAQDTDLDQPEGTERFSQILMSLPDAAGYMVSGVDTGTYSGIQKYSDTYDKLQKIIADAYGSRTSARRVDPVGLAIINADGAKSADLQLAGYQTARTLMDTLCADLRATIAPLTAASTGAVAVTINGVKYSGADAREQLAIVNIQLSLYGPTNGLQSQLVPTIETMIDLVKGLVMTLGWQLSMETVREKIPLRFVRYQSPPLLGARNLPLTSTKTLVGSSSATWLQGFADRLSKGTALPTDPPEQPLFYELVERAVNTVADADKKDLADALSLLATVEASELLRRVTSTLGLATHRLDAWLTSLATARLATLRAGERPSGLLIGGFGWVENLRPTTATPSQGYVLAPSLQQATTAALLRSGYSVHGEATRQSPLSVDLSSRRTRIARWLFDGVRQGQDLHALLGERFERMLHETKVNGHSLDYLIQPIRDLVQAGIRDVTSDPDAPPGPRVVDGLTLAKALEAEDPTLASAAVAKRLSAALAQNLVHPEDKSAWGTVTTDLLSYLDAAADAGLAESLHQLAAGNLERAMITTAAVDRGTAPPPDLQLPVSTRTGKTVHHRLLILLPTGGPIQSLERWLTGILGKPEDLRFPLLLADGSAGQVSLQGIGLTEFLRLVPERLEGSDLATALLPPGARFADGQPEDLLLLARSLRNLLSNARPLRPEDLGLPDQAIPDQERATKVEGVWSDYWSGKPDGLRTAATTFLDIPENTAFLTSLGRRKADLRAWLLQVARIRKAGAALWDSLSISEAIAGRSVGELGIAQLPDLSGEAWAGTAAPPDSRLSFCCWGSATTGPIRGLMVDSWSELVPGTSETGGITLHWNAPGARGPQLIALGVPDDRGWTAETVDALVLEIQAQAKLRAVQPNFVDLMGLKAGSLPLPYLLPAIYYVS